MPVGQKDRKYVREIDFVPVGQKDRKYVRDVRSSIGTAAQAGGRRSG